MRNMDLLRPGRRRSTDIQTAIRDEFRDAIQRRNALLEKFIPRESLERIWNSERFTALLHNLRLGVDRVSLQQDFLQTVSLLIQINWDGWGRFHEIFVQHLDRHGNRDRTDANIPEYTLEMLERPDFLGPVYGDKFLEMQYTFCPIDIREGGNVIRSREWRLPFLEGRSEVLGSGGYGHVTKEVIPRSHFIPSKGVSSVWSPSSQDEVPVARKVFISKGDFHKETWNLDRIRDSLAKHDRVVLHLATVAVGNEFNLLFPPANMDLEKFLQGVYLKPEDCDMSELIEEAARLAGALEHLHDRLGDGYPLRFCHRDLKPSNILVYRDDHPGDLHSHSPVGKWKITDFGLSVITRRETRPRPFEDFVTNTPIQSMRVVAGTYQAPEVCDGRGSGSESDVWSFGCILVRILAFKLDGIDGLRALDLRRGTGIDGESPYENDYFCRGSPLVLNPHIQDWIQNLPNRYRHDPQAQDFLICARDMLFAILQIEKPMRPVASKVTEMLQQLKATLPNPDAPEVLREIRSPTLPLPLPLALALPHPHPVTPESSVGSLTQRNSINSNSVSSSSSHPSSHRRPSEPTYAGPTATPKILVDTIKRGNANEVRTLLSGKVDVEQAYDKERPLVHAIRGNSQTIVRVLLDHAPSLDVESHDRDGNTPLRLAVLHDNKPIVEMLLEAQAHVDGESKHGMTALMAAARQGNEEILGLLLSKGADPMIYSDEGSMCLHYAMTLGQQQSSSACCDSGAAIIHLLRARLGTVDIPKQGSNEEMPFLTLVKNFVDTSFWWAKFYALLEGGVETGGADIDKADKNGLTPLCYAVEEQYPSLTKALLQNNASQDNLPSLDHLRSDMVRVIQRFRRPGLRRGSQGSSESRFSIHKFSKNWRKPK
ncbi:hypothetical protein FE257_002515 [Aspergillus nanangensis]|uniref:Protein kinase domain-containing protein n=1 Tax=Aspergillus nanangensis TaxID=2582783 RepID=A0AAD4GVV9_ASPNN|nr:hypothetical protein FE257_002515 [Aspergillus nanangensis]